MTDEASGIWKSLGIKSETVGKEIIQNKELLDALHTHFHVSNPFMLDNEFQIEGVDNVGTLDRKAKPEIKNILTGFVRKSDTDYDIFSMHQSKTYTMEKIPTSVNIMDIEYFLPMLAGAIDGYYKVEKVYFSTANGQMCLKLNLSTYISLGSSKVNIYSKMRPGELISYDLMLKLYERRI